MFRKKFLLLKFITIFFISISVSNAELIKPNSEISPSEVVKIQLLGLQKNNDGFKDSGIEQTWNFAHPNNKEVTGPLDKFKRIHTFARSPKLHWPRGMLADRSEGCRRVLSACSALRVSV